MAKQSNDTVNEVVEQGKEILAKANRRHIIVRNPNGVKVVDVTFGVAAAIGLLLLWLQPFGLILAFAGLAYAFYARLKLEIVHELGAGNNVVEMRLPKEDDEVSI